MTRIGSEIADRIGIGASQDLTVRTIAIRFRSRQTINGIVSTPEKTEHMIEGTVLQHENDEVIDAPAIPSGSGCNASRCYAGLGIEPEFCHLVAEEAR